MDAINWLIQMFAFLIDVYIALIVVAVVFSWLISFEVMPLHNPQVARVMDILDRITGPGLAATRRFVPLLGGLDLSPLVLIIILEFSRRLLLGTLAPLLLGQ